MAALQMKSSDAPGDPLAYWQDVVCDLFVPLSCSAAAESRFAWEFASGGRDDLRLVEMAVTPHRVRRSREQVARSTEGFFIISQQVDGPGVVIQDGREAVLQPGDLAIYDSTRPYELRFAGPMRQRIVRVPHALLTDKLSQTEQLTARAIRAQMPLGSLCNSFITSAFAILPTGEHSTWSAVRDALTDLLCAALREEDGKARPDDAVSSRVLRRRILRFIETNLRDPELDVAQIAAAMRLSSRYVHMLLQQGGTTPGKLIWSQRLLRCAEALSDPAQASMPVSQIAYAWGYKDAAHFSRSFRSQFQMSPSEFRKREMSERPAA